MKQNSVETLTQEEIREVDNAIDAHATVQAIGVWTQIPHIEQRTFFSGDRRPATHPLIPKDVREREAFYSQLSSKVVSEWKNEPDNPDKKALARSVIEDCVRDLYLPRINAQILKNNGHLVDQHGISKGVSKRYLRSLQNFADSSESETTLADLSVKTGGLTIDMLDQAQSNLQLTEDADTFINSFYLHRRKGSGFEKRLLSRLRTAQAVRKHYADAGIDLNNLMSLWGIDKTFEETKVILRSLSIDKSRQDKLLTAVAELHPKAKTVTEAQAYFSRARHLNLPTQLSSWDETSNRNAQILESVARSMHFTEITGLTPESQVIFTGKPGARTRGVNASYMNLENNLVNIPLVSAYAPEPQKVKTTFHELTHALHVHLISKLFGYETWNKIDSGVKELFAKLVDESATANNSESAEISDYFRPALVSWFQPIYGYAQLRLLEEISTANYTLSDRELLATEKRITEEVLSLYVLSNNDLTFDLTQLRRTLFDSQKPSDGIVYVISEINSEQNSAKDTKNLAQNSPSKELFVKRWGERWIYNTEAFELLIAAVIASHELPSTNAVNAYIQTLFEAGSERPKNILSQHRISLN